MTDFSGHGRIIVTLFPFIFLQIIDYAMSLKTEFEHLCSSYVVIPTPPIAVGSSDIGLFLFHFIAIFCNSDTGELMTAWLNLEVLTPPLACLG